MKNTVLINIPPHILKRIFRFLKCSVLRPPASSSQNSSSSFWVQVRNSPVKLLSSHRASGGGSPGLARLAARSADEDPQNQQVSKGASVTSTC